MAYVQGDTHAAFGNAGDTGLAGPKKRRRKAAKREVRAALRAGTSTEGLNQRLVAKLTGKQVAKGKIEAPAGFVAPAPNWRAVIAENQAQKREAERARRQRHEERLAAGTTQKQVRERAEQAEKDARRRQERAELEARTAAAEAYVPQATDQNGGRPAQLTPTNGDRYPPPPPDRRLGWEWTGYEWVWSPPLQELPEVFQPRATNGGAYGGGGGGSPFDFTSREPVTAGAPESRLPSWLIPAAIGAAVYFL